MKAKINNENKSKFFAQYWGQDVLTVGNALCENLPENWIESSLNHTQYLQLKPLSEISDGDAIACAKILDPDKSHGDWEQILEVKEDFVNVFSYDLDESIDDVNPVQFAQLADFLRSRGYLVPFLGLSCEELIEAGWAKYSEE